jgi:hypothetical protein
MPHFSVSLAFNAFAPNCVREREGALLENSQCSPLVHVVVGQEATLSCSWLVWVMPDIGGAAPVWTLGWAGHDKPMDSSLCVVEYKAWNMTGRRDLGSVSFI